jgi:hypothetical protein
MSGNGEVGGGGGAWVCVRGGGKIAKSSRICHCGVVAWAPEQWWLWGSIGQPKSPTMQQACSTCHSGAAVSVRWSMKTPKEKELAQLRDTLVTRLFGGAMAPTTPLAGRWAAMCCASNVFAMHGGPKAFSGERWRGWPVAVRLSRGCGRRRGGKASSRGWLTSSGWLAAA